MGGEGPQRSSYEKALAEQLRYAHIPEIALRISDDLSRLRPFEQDHDMLPILTSFFGDFDSLDIPRDILQDGY
jgi:hypothetical protein